MTFDFIDSDMCPWCFAKQFMNMNTKYDTMPGLLAVLTHWSMVTLCCGIGLIIIGNGLAWCPIRTKPLPQPILIHYHWHPDQLIENENFIFKMADALLSPQWV